MPANPYSRAPFANDGWSKYIRGGFVWVENLIANAILVHKTGDKDATIDMGYIPSKSAEYIEDDFTGVIEGLLPFFLGLVYILPIAKLTERMVSEKETRARESMKMMGMSDSAYFFSWFTYFFIQVTLITILGLAMLKPIIFPNTDGGLIFLMLWIYGLSQFGFVMMV